MTSLCPEKYLVALCREMCAPWSSGFWYSGVAQVLSTTTRASFPRPSRWSRSARMPTLRRKGLVGVSKNTIRASSGIWPKLAGSPRSTTTTFTLRRFSRRLNALKLQP